MIPAILYDCIWNASNLPRGYISFFNAGGSMGPIHGMDSAALRRYVPLMINFNERNSPEQTVTLSGKTDRVTLGQLTTQGSTSDVSSGHRNALSNEHQCILIPCRIQPYLPIVPFEHSSTLRLRIVQAHTSFLRFCFLSG